MIVDCRALWPNPARRDEQLVHFAMLAGKLGAAVKLPRPFLFAIRGVKPYAPETHDLVHAPGYTDTFVMLPPGDYPVVFPGSTVAYQKDSKASPDADGDGRGDVGSIRPGRYLLTDKRNGDEVVFEITNPDGSKRLKAWRDFDHDGKLSPEEMQRSEELRTGKQVGADGTWADSVLFHGGLDEPNRPDGTPAKHRFSIACFTASRPWRKLLADTARGTGGQIDMVLANAWDLLPLVEPAPSGDSDAPPAPEGVA